MIMFFWRMYRGRWEIGGRRLFEVGIRLGEGEGEGGGEGREEVAAVVVVVLGGRREMC